MATTKSTDQEKDADWLKRNAVTLDFEAQKNNSTESWKRALDECTEAHVQGRHKRGLFEVHLPDGDVHLALIAKDKNDTYAGACDCDGFQYHTEACTHLCVLAQEDALKQIIPLDDNLVDELHQDLNVEHVDHTEDDVEEIEDDDDLDEDLVDIEDPPDQYDDDHAGGPTPQETEIVEREGDVETQTPASTQGNVPADPSNGAFAGELPNVDDQYVMEMGGDTYIRRAGYARLARSDGFRLKFEEVVGAHETDWTRSKYRAVVLDEDGEQVSEDVGSAGPPANEDMADAESNLDELAATRAATRALAWATGEGLNAVEEVAEEHAEQAR